MDLTSVIRDGAQQLQKVIGREPANDSPLVLELDLTKGVLDAVPQSPLGMFRARQLPTLAAIRRGLRVAVDDDQVGGLVIDVGAAELPAYLADEIGDLVASFAEHKPVVAFAATFGEVGSGLFAYRLATAASSIWVQPSGGVNLPGIQAQILLLRGGLDKLDIVPEFSQRKEFKSAAEQIAGTEVSEANREMTQRLADSFLDSVIGKVATARDRSTEEIQAAVDRAMIDATTALELGLVDQVGYRDQVYSWVREHWGADGELRLQYIQRYAEKHSGGPLGPLLQRSRPAIGVVTVRGGITTGPSQPGSPLGGPSAGSDTIGAALRAAGRDDKVKAVVLRVDSPGGSYVASDAIRREVLQLREQGKTVVASMGSVAASGGYFVSMAAQEIVADPTTLTGSIGVLAGKLVTQGLYGKLGLVREALTAGRNAGMLSAVQGFSDEQWDLLNAWLDTVYADFTAKAAADRAMDLDDLESRAKGRVWTGADALDQGLVDHLGGLDLAIDRACDLAGLDRDRLAVRPVPALGPLSQLRPQDNSEALSSAQTAPALSGWEGILSAGAAALGVQHRGVLSMPFDIQIR